MANVETFAREVKKLKKKVGVNRELTFYCDSCGQPLKSQEHGELIRQRHVEEAEETRATLQRIFARLGTAI